MIEAAEQAQKLATIATLPADEIDGYHAHALERGMFAGEKLAILARIKAVKK